jgi:23S rRNA (guanine2445-N2)-methyltransferase / 23S rRNA (guanine2069-N7)-methyltransferase
MIFSLFISCPKGLEYLLEDELKTLGLQITRVHPHGVYGEGTIGVIYHLCLWSRLANRVQVILFDGEATDQSKLYELCRQYPWETVFLADKTLAIEFHGTSPDIRNSMFGAQVIKDAIVDHFREQSGIRPTIARDAPQIRLHAYLKNNNLTVSFDLTGYSLHQRGYRLQSGLAPLKENIAAAMLIRAKWPQLVAAGFSLYDPFCGSGTLVIEAAMMAAKIAPGLIRDDQSFHHWIQHQPLLWDKAKLQAKQEATPIAVTLYGSDLNAELIPIARANAERAGIDSMVEFCAMPLSESRPFTEKGLVICNPPYGERMGETPQLVSLYQELGHVLHTYYQGWQAAVLTANPLLAKAMGLRSSKQYTLYNGALECKLYTVLVDATNQLKHTAHAHLSTGADMLVNRLKKNHQHLQKWAKRQQISCYRVYDADLPEYAYAIDIYNDHAVLQEYTAPSVIAQHKVEQRSLDVYQVVPMVLGIAPENLVIKKRQQQKGLSQYQKLNHTRHTLLVNEGRAKFKVNLYDYLDTGLFLDHRPLRLRFAQLPPDTHFLNCFSYTATASVHAALSGAITTSVDLSRTYLNWAEENFKLNHLDLSAHRLIHEDCLTWIKKTRDRFDVIFLDPPSFSNSKRMIDTLDIQRDHEALIRASMHLLYPGGVLYFSTNLRHFKLSQRIIDEYSVRDISAETIDVDFKRNQRIHQCFMMSNQ